MPEMHSTVNKPNAMPPAWVHGQMGRKIGLFTGLFLVALLAGCAGVPVTSNSQQGIAPATGEAGCEASPPNLRAAYNRRYTVLGRSYTPLRTADGYEVEGKASWYGSESGTTTAMGMRFSPSAFTAASRTLPLPTCVQVTNLGNGRSVFVLVNDRGPFVAGRIMDLSYGAAKALGVTSTGTARVRILAVQGNGSSSEQANTSRMQDGQGMNSPRVATVARPSSKTDPAAPEQFAPVAQTAPADNAPVTAAPFIVEPLSPMGQSSEPPVPVTAPVQQAAQDPAAISDGVPAGSSMEPQQQPQQTIARQAEPSLATASGEPSPGAPQTYLQTGAFTMEQNARDERQRLQAAGIESVEIVHGSIGGKAYYRVLVGPLPESTPDLDLQQRLEDLGVTSYKVVQQ